MAAAGTAGLAMQCNKPEVDATIKEVAGRPVRRDISTMLPSELDTFRTAINAMKALPTWDRRNWSRQAELHQTFCPHANWYVLPWHRAYLNQFEEICRQLTGNNAFALPYWNWSKYPSIPSAFFGPATDPLSYSPRLATASSVASLSMVGPANVANIMSQPNFLVFGSGQIPPANQKATDTKGPLEQGPHDYVHDFVGGTMGSFLSPLDPIFWTHHNMIEHVWWEWNLTKKNPNTSKNKWRNKTFSEFCDRYGNLVTISVKKTLEFPYTNYRFDDLVIGI